MLEIQTPRNVNFNIERGTSTLFLDNDIQVECYIRGGICWPLIVGSGQSRTVEGYAVLCAQDIRTKIIYVFDEFSFLSVDNLIDPDTHNLTHNGLSQFFTRCWKDYFGKYFFYKQPQFTHKDWAMRVSRSVMIEPKPNFIRLVWNEDRQADQSIYERAFTGKLFYCASDGVDRAMMAREQEDVDLPAYCALRAAVVGIEKYPYREKKV